MAKKWTENRRKVAAYLTQYFEENQRAPTMSEIADALGMWKRSVELVLKGLDKIGFLELTPGISRGIRLIEEHLRRVPLLGEVQAGQPPLSQEEPPEYIKVDKNLVRFDSPIAMRVQGFSMRDAGILPGDIILIRKQDTAQNGETVVAFYNGGVTIKTFFRAPTGYELRPANPAFEPMAVSKEDEFFIIGKVMLVVRDLGGCLNMQFETSEAE